jgi:hypothetical protein
MLVYRQRPRINKKEGVILNIIQKAIIKDNARSSCSKKCWGKEIHIISSTTKYDNYKGYVQNVDCDGPCVFYKDELIFQSNKELF